MRRLFLKRGVRVVAVVYVGLWVATAVFGPAAAEARQRAHEDAYYGVDADSHRTRLHRFVVPAPFVVLADWDAGGARVGRVSYSKGDHRGIWVPGAYWVVRDRMTLVACGIAPAH